MAINRCRSNMIFLPLILFLALIPEIALSQNTYSQGFSPWCLVRDENETCNYGSEQICFDAALKVGGYCRANARRAGLKGDLEWCVVNSSGRNCTYYSQEQCLREAVRVDGGCVYNTERALQKSAEQKEAFGLIIEETLEQSGQNQLADQLQEVQAEAQAEEEAAAAPGAGGP